MLNHDGPAIIAGDFNIRQVEAAKVLQVVLGINPPPKTTDTIKKLSAVMKRSDTFKRQDQPIKKVNVMGSASDLSSLKSSIVLDCWEATGSKEALKYTWTHPDPDKKYIRARYDRVYVKISSSSSFSNSSSTISSSISASLPYNNGSPSLCLTPIEFHLVCTHIMPPPVSTTPSDHFGIFVRFVVGGLLLDYQNEKKRLASVFHHSVEESTAEDDGDCGKQTKRKLEYAEKTKYADKTQSEKGFKSKGNHVYDDGVGSPPVSSTNESCQTEVKNVGRGDNSFSSTSDIVYTCLNENRIVDLTAE
jgi:uncharacterized protein YxeA